jgi:hypothetical protein
LHHAKAESITGSLIMVAITIINNNSSEVDDNSNVDFTVVVGVNNKVNTIKTRGRKTYVDTIQPRLAEL